MIIFITSTTLRYEKLRAHAEILCSKYEGSQVVTLDRDAPHAEQAAEADKLLALNGGIVFCPSDSELALLRLLRFVRKGLLPVESLDLIVLDKDGKEHSIRVDPSGEFQSMWPEGCFEARLNELFDKTPLPREQQNTVPENA